MVGYVLFSHGSLLCGAGAALDRHADRLRHRLGLPVEIGYLNYSEPTFESGVAALASTGVRRVIVVPYFLAPGYFVGHSLPEKLSEARAAHPDLEFTVAEVLGADELLADAVLESARNAGPDPAVWRDVYADAALRCRDRPDCPLYGGPHCPASTALYASDTL